MVPLFRCVCLLAVFVPCAYFGETMFILFLVNLLTALRSFLLWTVPKEVSILMAFSIAEWDVFIINALELDLTPEYQFYGLWKGS